MDLNPATYRLADSITPNLDPVSLSLARRLKLHPAWLILAGCQLAGQLIVCQTADDLRRAWRLYLDGYHGQWFPENQLKATAAEISQAVVEAELAKIDNEVMTEVMAEVMTEGPENLD